MSESIVRRRRWPWVAAVTAAAIGLVLFIASRPAPLTETEQRMLGTWQYRDTRIEYTFRNDRSFVSAFRDGPTQFGRWSASDGKLTSFEFDRDSAVSPSTLFLRFSRFFLRRAPRSLNDIEFVDDDQMKWVYPFGSIDHTRNK